MAPGRESFRFCACHTRIERKVQKKLRQLAVDA
jgi:hypothetical protein